MKAALKIQAEITATYIALALVFTAGALTLPEQPTVLTTQTQQAQR